MAQTERTCDELDLLLADNVLGAISPRDLRDALASLQGYGAMVLSYAGGPVTLTGVGTGFSLIDIYDTVSAQSVDRNINGVSATLATGRLTIPVAGLYLMNFFASFTSSVNNIEVHFRPHVSGSPALIEADRKIGSGADVGSIAISNVVPFAAGDFADVRVKIDTGTTNLTFRAAGLSCHRVG